MADVKKRREYTWPDGFLNLATEYPTGSAHAASKRVRPRPFPDGGGDGGLFSGGYTGKGERKHGRRKKRRRRRKQRMRKRQEQTLFEDLRQGNEYTEREN